MNTTKIKQFVPTLVIVSIISVLVNVVILVLAKAYTGAPATFGPFMYSPVIGLTVLGVIGASVVYLVLQKYSQNYNNVFKIVSYVALLLSFIPDLQLPYSKAADDVGATPIVIGVLILMHITTALIVIYYFTREKDRD